MEKTMLEKQAEIKDLKTKLQNAQKQFDLLQMELKAVRDAHNNDSQQ